MMAENDKDNESDDFTEATARNNETVPFLECKQSRSSQQIKCTIANLKWQLKHQCCPVVLDFGSILWNITTNFVQ